MKIPRGIGIEPPAQMAPQLVQRPAPKPIPRPVAQIHQPATAAAHQAPPETRNAPASSSPGNSTQNTRGWMIGAGALAAILVAWLAWTWPDGNAAQTAAISETTAAVDKNTVPQPVPAPSAATITTTPSPVAPTEQPARPAPSSPWDALFTTTMPGE